MKENTRNVAVGLAVLVALCILAGMILLFAGLPAAFHRGYTLRMTFPATADAREGDPIHLRGMAVGQVTHIGFTDGDPRKGVTLTTRIDRHVRIPANTKAYIYTKGLAGGAYVQLEPSGELPLDPATGRPMQFLPTDRVTVLAGVLKTGMIPDDVREGLKSFSKLAENLNKLIAPESAPAATTGPAATGPAARPQGLKATVAKLNKALDGLNDVLDEKNRANFRKMLANLSATSGEAEKLTRKLVEDADKLSTVLDTVNRAVKKLDSGQGSAAKFLNDPELYHNLVDAGDQLTKLLTEMRQLTQQWKEKGVNLKLK